MSDMQEMRQVDFTAFIAGIAAKQIKPGQNAAVESVHADYVKRIVVVATTNGIVEVPFERVEALRPVADVAEKKKTKKDQ